MAMIVIAVTLVVMTIKMQVPNGVVMSQKWCSMYMVVKVVMMVMIRDIIPEGNGEEKMDKQES